MKKRIEYIDITKAFAIFCVILGHCIDWSTLGDPCECDTLFAFIYSFHMPLFMMLSGLFLGKTLALPFKDMLKRRFVQLLLPVLSFSTLYFVINNTILHFVFGLPMIGIDKCLLGSDLWFLKYLFADIVIAWVCFKLFRKDWLAATLPTLLLFSLTRSTIYRLLPFLWVGYFIYKYHDKFQKYNKQIAIFSLLIFSFFLFFWKGTYDFPVRFIYLNTPAHIDVEALGIAMLRFGVGLSGSVFFISFFSLVSSHIRPETMKNYLANVGGNTLGIYSLQLYILERGLSSIALPPEIGGNDLIKMVFAILLLVIFNALVELIAKNRIAALLFLGRK